MNADYVVASPVDDERREVERIVDELAELEERADILAEDYVVAIDEKNQLDEEVVAARARVAAKEAELEALRGDLSEVAVRAFTGAGGDVLGPLFSNAAAYSDTLQRDQLSRVALSVGTSTTDDLDALIADLDAERADLADKLEAAEALTETIAEAQAATVELTAEYQERRAEAEAELGDAIAAEEAASRRGVGPPARRAMPPRRRPAPPLPAAAGSGGRWRRRDTGGGGSAAVTVAVAAAAAAAPRRRRTRRTARRRQRRSPIRSTTRRRRRWRGRRSPLPSPSRVSRTSLRRGDSRGGVRLLRSHVVRVGAGRRLPAAPVAGAGGDRCRTCRRARPNRAT